MDIHRTDLNSRCSENTTNYFQLHFLRLDSIQKCTLHILQVTSKYREPCPGNSRMVNKRLHKLYLQSTVHGTRHFHRTWISSSSKTGHFVTALTMDAH
ncbi:hypothetical protein M758_12G151200 [Ceratodon purpureus]|nr:hypothetical protein M758_12G151200 [Ceratodon purpureus]